MSGPTRLIVKNLPKRIDEEKLRAAFSARGGTVTDVSLKYSAAGVFRHFGFVGFRTAEEAEAARVHLNGTFLGASKVTVEVCADLGDAQKPRAWSKHSAESSAFARNQKKSEEETTKPDAKKKKTKKELVKQMVRDLLEKYKDDAKFQEFLRVHKRNLPEGSKWDSDTILEVAETYGKDESEADQVDEESQADGAKNEELSDLDYLKSKMVDDTVPAAAADDAEGSKKPSKKTPKNEEYFTVKISGLPYKAKKKHVKTFLKPMSAKSIRVPPKIKGIAYVGFATEADRKKALLKNKSFLLGHQVFLRKYDGSTKEKGAKTAKWKEQEESLKQEDTIGESGRIFVRNLAYTVTEEEVENMFKKFGPLTEVNLPIDKVTRKTKGFAFVTFMIPEHATRAYAELDGTSLQGRLLHLLPGKAKASPEEENPDAQGLNYKQKKAAQEKKKAGSSHNWNTLFLGTSAVADLMAERYGVSKRDVLTNDGGKQSAAVRLALGETQVVAETRKFLEQQGVSLDAFDGANKPERSKTVIIVKNLPARTSLEEVRDTFAKYGELGRVVLPPGCVTALVEFFEPTEARAAFKNLAYSKFRNVPLYLEWAPENAFSSEAKRGEEKNADIDHGTIAAVDQNATLFVKNLNFSTTEETLREHFSAAGTVHSVTISRKKDSKRPGELLSMGYGFVQFQDAAAADKALKTLQHKMVDSHCLELKRSNRTTTEQTPVQPARKGSSDVVAAEDSSKLLVRNIPFEAKAREVEDVFKVFGALKSVRLPKKVTGSHRGFAFVEFETREDAKRALEALKHSTHLYGRRLVLEWAAQEETIQQMQKRSARQLDSAPTHSKRVKKAKVMEDLALASSGGAA